MIDLVNHGVVLKPRDKAFEKGGVFNPACVYRDGLVHMFYRAVAEGNRSTIGYCQLRDNKVVYQADEPVLVPEYQYELQGLEDPRITFLEGRYYMFYTGFDGVSAVVAYATSQDLKKWDKQGLISPRITYDEAEDIFRHSGVDEKYIFFERLFRKKRGEGVMLWEKDAALFPKKINGKYAVMHRILPGIQVLFFDSFEQLTMDFWREYLVKLKDFVVLEPKLWFESGYIGGGCTPIEVDDGWLLIYHAVEKAGGGDNDWIYRAAAALLDKDDPRKVIGVLKEPLFEPQERWEKEGIVNNVVFPTGAVAEGKMLTVYYGAADKTIGAKSMSIDRLIREIKK